MILSCMNAAFALGILYFFLVWSWLTQTLPNAQFHGQIRP